MMKMEEPLITVDCTALTMARSCLKDLTNPNSFIPQPPHNVGPKVTLFLHLKKLRCRDVNYFPPKLCS
jgi:hypothetical protein